MSEEFEARLRAAARTTDGVLDRLLSPTPEPGEIARPRRLMEAMRYAVLGPGKRLRPFLLIESARLFGAERDSIVAAAAALECVHSYSLAHDDLPAMDDDDMRRGRPTVHKTFDEATAILAGDALLTLAFETLARLDEPADMRATLVANLARAAGLAGMAGGQMLDLAGVGVAGDPGRILAMQQMKTGALFRYACESGALLGGAGAADRQALAAFGERLGQAFQLADDLIDVAGAAHAAGKATGKDSGRGKATLVAMHGIDDARTMLKSINAEAAALLAPFSNRASVLLAGLDFAAHRTY